MTRRWRAPPSASSSCATGGSFGISQEAPMRSSIKDSVVMALQVPVRNPGRSALTTLGLAIGVSAFIAMVSFGRGARTSVVAQFEALGANVLTVRTQFGLTDSPPHLLDEGDVEALRKQTTAIAVVVPFGNASVQVAANGVSRRIAIRGTTPEYLIT